jgi:predicted nucleic acid-binding protein
MAIYLDTCALNRLTDEPSQPRIVAEAEAIDRILELVAATQVEWIASVFLRVEIERNPVVIRRAQTLPLLDMASGHVAATPEIFRRARALQAEGFQHFDALHLAVCEESSIACLLTVDDRLVRRASRRPQTSVTEVLNPIDWLKRRGAWQPIP